ncbi:phospholipase D family protein [Algicella marina]|uniref:Phospholipase D n=1 Tax=Algicella marina TaxID=2683284 RepID=A0A6P1SWI1_9RHOB|nr:phospholipase D-like domain-containing protein [Algicella marina]QHQ35034.1 phospholipase [Algicella marina]
MSVETFKTLFTAAEAFPALEGLFLEARSEIRAGFRIFDLDTRLRSERARAIGRTWYDLMFNTLERGVDIHFTLSDFDAIAGPDLHRGTWTSAAQFYSLAEETRDFNGTLYFNTALHPAKSGILPRIAFSPLVRRRLARQIAELNAMPAEERKGELAVRPGLNRLVHEDEDGTLRQRRRPFFPTVSPATHHQKLAVADGEKLIIGGIDVDERRYDTPEHERPAEETWQDISALVTGPVAADAADHLATFVDAAHPPPPGSAFLKTQSEPHRKRLLGLAPQMVCNQMEEATCELIASARQLIYLETQFFRSRVISRVLADAAHANPELGLILIIPAAPEDVAFEGKTGLDARYGEYLQARAVRRVRRAFGNRAFIGMPLQPVRSTSDGRDAAHGSPIIYIHSKLTIADETGAILSSANLNGRSMRWDTEAGLRLEDPAHVRELRSRAFAHWLPENPAPEYFGLRSAVTNWRSLATANIAKAPEDRQGFLAPYSVRAAEEFGSPAPGIPEDSL